MKTETYEVIVDECADGSVLEQWFLKKEGKRLRHRTDGPACISINGVDGTRCEDWWYEGELHREDGPAVIETSSDGTTRRGWYYKGKYVHNELFHAVKIGQRILDNRPKGSTGFYMNNGSIQWGYRTNRDKAPDNYIFFDEVENT